VLQKKKQRGKRDNTHLKYMKKKKEKRENNQMAV